MSGLCHNGAETQRKPSSHFITLVLGICTLFMIAFYFAAATPAGAQNVKYQQDSNWRPPQDAARKANPLASKPQLAAGGKKLFAHNCAECHGHAGEGLKKAADLQLPVVQEQSDGALFWKITNGNPDRGMPPWSGMPEMQRWQLVLYIRTLKRDQPEP